MKLSIILVSYNTESLTIQCIQSIYKHCNLRDFEIILVDNASCDNTVQYIRDTFPQVKIIQSQINLGFGRANNLALKVACGEYCFLLNTDTIIIDDSIQKLVAFLDCHQDISIVGAQLINENEEQIHSYSMCFPSICWEFNLLFYPIFKRFQLKKKSHLNMYGYCDVSYITGADMMIRSKDLQLVGYFDDAFFMYFEETDLSYRFSKKHLRSVFYPAAKIIHLEGASFIFKETRERMYYDSRKLFYEKHYSPFYHHVCNSVHSAVLHVLYIISKYIKPSSYNLYKQKYRIFKEYK